jgi:cytochrome P450 family 6
MKILILTGAGNRNCIGMRFGLMQTKIGIAAVVKNFKLSHHKTTRYPMVLDPKSVVVNSLKPILIHAEMI